MAKVNEQNLNKVEQILQANAQWVKESLVQFSKTLESVTNDTFNKTEQELREDFDQTFCNLNFREYFEKRLSNLSVDFFDKKVKSNIIELNLMGIWVPITKDEIISYHQLDQEEARKKYLDELYIHKLCEWWEVNK